MNIPTAELESLRLSAAAAAWLPEIQRRLIGRFHPDRIILFGSQARGEAADSSDIDLLVVVPEASDRRQAAAEMYAALRGIPVGTDIAVVSRADVVRYQHTVGTILRPALQEGVTIYARADAITS